jgi:hypothetical protein
MRNVIALPSLFKIHVIIRANIRRVITDGEILVSPVEKLKVLGWLIDYSFARPLVK